MKEDGISAERINEVTKNVAGIAFGAAGDTVSPYFCSIVIYVLNLSLDRP